MERRVGCSLLVVEMDQSELPFLSHQYSNALEQPFVSLGGLCLFPVGMNVDGGINDPRQSHQAREGLLKHLARELGVD